MVFSCYSRFRALLRLVEGLNSVIMEQRKLVVSFGVLFGLALFSLRDKSISQCYSTSEDLSPRTHEKIEFSFGSFQVVFIDFGGAFHDALSFLH